MPDFTPESEAEGEADAIGRDGQARGRLASAISNMVVRMYSDYTGRGPTRARTVIQGTIVTVVLQDTLTKAERRLIERGEERAVIGTRRTFQQTMRDDLVENIERLTGSRVVAFLSDHQADPDYAVENFVLDSPPVIFATGAGAPG